MIKEPAKFKSGLTPKAGLSKKDTAQVKFFYPPLKPQYPELKLLRVQRLAINAGEQVNFTVLPTASRSYNFRTFGNSDTVMVLFEDDNGEMLYVTGDDDSGSALNASFRVRLYKGRKYILRIRLYFNFSSGDAAVMMW